MNKQSLIVKTSVKFFQAPLYQPFRVASGQHDHLENILFTIELKDGTKGHGEAAVATHITGETIEQTLKNLKGIAIWLKGKAIEDYLEFRRNLHERLPHNKSAVAAVEMAIFDALTRYLRIPLWRLWTQVQSACVQISPLSLRISKRPRTRAKAFKTQGFRAFKIKIGRDMDMDFKRVEAVCGIAPALANHTRC